MMSRAPFVFFLILPLLGTQPASDDPALLDTAVPELLKKHRVAGAGIGIIRAGELTWTGYYGLQRPGVPVTRETMFNTASMAKTVTAETILRLVSKGAISLDEPIAAHYAHPELADDPRYRLLTPRLILSHQAGLLNWSYDYPDGKLAFIA